MSDTGSVLLLTIEFSDSGVATFRKLLTNKHQCPAWQNFYNHLFCVKAKEIYYLKKKKLDLLWQLTLKQQHNSKVWEIPTCVYSLTVMKGRELTWSPSCVRWCWPQWRSPLAGWPQPWKSPSKTSQRAAFPPAARSRQCCSAIQGMERGHRGRVGSNTGSPSVVS